MIITDINRHLKPPTDHQLYSVSAEGSFLVVEYHQSQYEGEVMRGWSTVIVYLNDFGREVARTEKFTKIAPRLPIQDWSDGIHSPVKVPSWWLQIYLKVWRFFHAARSNQPKN